MRITSQIKISIEKKLAITLKYNGDENKQHSDHI